MVGMGSTALAAVPYPGKATRIPNEFHARDKEVTKKKKRKKERKKKRRKKKKKKKKTTTTNKQKNG